MNANRKSDESVVPATPANNGAVKAPAELVEERDSAKRNADEAALHRTRSRENASHADGTACVKLLSRRTQGRSRMRQFLTYGSVRGAAGNGGPYRDQRAGFPFRLSAGNGRRLRRGSFAGEGSLQNDAAKRKPY